MAGISQIPLRFGAVGRSLDFIKWTRSALKSILREPRTSRWSLSVLSLSITKASLWDETSWWSFCISPLNNTLQYKKKIEQCLKTLIMFKFNSVTTVAATFMVLWFLFCYSNSLICSCSIPYLNFECGRTLVNK